MLATIGYTTLCYRLRNPARINPFYLFGLAIRHCLIISYAIKLNLIKLSCQDRIGNGHGSVGVTF